MLVRPPRTRLAAWTVAVVGSAVLWFSLATPAFGASAAVNLSALQAQALTLADLPTGWVAASGTSSGGAAQGCGGKPFGASHRIAKVDGSFQDPSGLPELFETIAVYRSASSVFRYGTSAIDRCHTVSLTEGGIKLKIHVTKLAYPGGKKTAAYSLKFSVKGQTVGIDVVVEEIGNEIAQVGVANVPGPALSQLKQFVTEAVNKIEKSPPAPG